MTKMLFKVCTVMICSLFLFSCEKDKFGDAIESYSLMDYYEQIKNKAGIEVESLECANPNNGSLSTSSSIECANGDTTVLWGFRNNKIWIGLFNKQTKEQLIEWTSDKAVNRDITIDKGYGEFENVHIDKFDFSFMKYTPFGFISEPFYVYGIDEKKTIMKDWILINGNNMVLYPTTIENKIYRPYQYEIWYKNSIILHMRAVSGNEFTDSYIAVVSLETGKDIYILQDYPQSGYADFEVQPLSYTDGLSFNQSYIAGNTGLYECIERMNYETGKEVWKTPITQLKDIKNNARKTITVLNKDDKQWTFQFDVVNYDGSKQQVKFSVDIATGEIMYL